MQEYLDRHVARILLALSVAACTETTSPTLLIQTAPDFGARVVSIHRQQFIAPIGPVDQYALWVAIAPSDTANAGVLVTAAQPLFVRAKGVLAVDSVADIAAGDSILVWHDRFVSGPSAQAPPGAPGYSATQIVIVR